MPLRRREALSDVAICPSVCLSVRLSVPPELCRLRIRPRTDVDPPRSAAGGISSRRAITCCRRYLVFCAVAIPYSGYAWAAESIIFSTCLSVYRCGRGILRPAYR